MLASVKKKTLQTQKSENEWKKNTLQHLRWNVSHFDVFIKVVIYISVQYQCFSIRHKFVFFSTFPSPLSGTHFQYALFLYLYSFPWHGMHCCTIFTYNVLCLCFFKLVALSVHCTRRRSRFSQFDSVIKFDQCLGMLQKVRKSEKAETSNLIRQLRYDVCLCICMQVSGK